jgi:antitoxin ParD1/3/4
MRNENITTMNISLTEMTKEHVQDRVADGTYTSISDYVRNLIRADMMRPNKLENLRRLVREGTDALDRGEGIPLTKHLLEGIKARGRAELDRQHG